MLFFWIILLSSGYRYYTNYTNMYNCLQDPDGSQLGLK